MRHCIEFVVITLLLHTTSLAADPWGKDADLANREAAPTEQIPKKCPTPIFGNFAEVMIGFHQQVISPADGPRSHFKPSSSQYTLEAMRTYGFFVGLTKGCDRLMRENDEEWVYRWTVDGAGKPIKYDPVR